MSRHWPGYAIKSRLFGGLETVMFRCTQHVVVNTQEFAERLRVEQPRLAVTLVTNGTDVEALPIRTAERLDGLSIAYAGTVYLERSFTALLGALESLQRDRGADGARVKLRIAGRMGDAEREALGGELARRGLTDVVELVGAIPRSAALDMLRRSHVAVVLAQGQPSQVPAKLYECVGLGVPTLVIAEHMSAASRESRRIGGMAVEPDDAAGLRGLLESLVDGRLPATVAAAAPISYQALATEMDQLLRRTCAPAN
jgi:glycosyltransferase involved in cell wall biosynthesis